MKEPILPAVLLTSGFSPASLPFLGRTFPAALGMNDRTSHTSWRIEQSLPTHSPEQGSGPPCGALVRFRGSRFLLTVFKFGSWQKTSQDPKEKLSRQTGKLAQWGIKWPHPALCSAGTEWGEPSGAAHLCSIWNAPSLAPEERVTPDGYHVWNWNPRGTGSEKKQSRLTGRLAELLTYLPEGKIRPQARAGWRERGVDKEKASTELTTTLPRELVGVSGVLLK